MTMPSKSIRRYCRVYIVYRALTGKLKTKACRDAHATASKLAMKQGAADWYQIMPSDVLKHRANKFANSLDLTGTNCRAREVLA